MYEKLQKADFFWKFSPIGCQLEVLEKKSCETKALSTTICYFERFHHPNAGTKSKIA